MRRLLGISFMLALLLGVYTAPAHAQFQSVSPIQGNITAATTNASCVPTIGNGAVDQQLNSVNGSVGVSVTGTWVATLNIQVSVDHGKTWTAQGSTFAANQQTVFSSAGYSDVCVFASAYTSGTAVVQFSTSIAAPSSSNGSGATSTQVQGCGPADAAAVCNPVLVGGVDNAGNVQELPVADQGTAVPAQTVLVGGKDGSGNIQPIAVAAANSLGAIVLGLLTAAADGAGQVISPLNTAGTGGAGLLTAQDIFNGTSWDRSIYCPNTLFQPGIAATTTQIIPLASGAKIRICSVIIERNDVTGVATTLKLVEGTGANCATGQVSFTGNLFTSGTTAVTTDSPPVVMNFGATGPLTTLTAGDAVCVQTTGAASSFDVTVAFERH